MLHCESLTIAGTVDVALHTDCLVVVPTNSVWKQFETLCDPSSDVAIVIDPEDKAVKEPMKPTTTIRVALHIMYGRYPCTYVQYKTSC